MEKVLLSLKGKSELYSREGSTLSIDIKDVEKMERREDEADILKFHIDYTLSKESSYRSFNKNKGIVFIVPLTFKEIGESNLKVVLERMLKSDILVKAVEDGDF